MIEEKLVSAQQTELRCVCGYNCDDPYEMLTCAQRGSRICLQCEYRHPKTCKSYCRACAHRLFGRAQP